MSRLCAWVVILASTAVIPRMADAQMYGVTGESPRSQQIEFKFGPYTPDIDDEGGSFYSTVFGKPMFMFRFQYDYQFWQEVGSLAAGFEVGYGSVTGNGFLEGTSTESSDETRLQMVPMALTLSYHLDILPLWYDVPLVPYAKVGIDYNIWWITDGTGDTAEYADPVAGKIFTGAGDTWGFHVAAGLKILLDAFAPKMAQTFDNEIGVNNSYLFAEFFYANISDFGSNDSIQLGTITGLFGLAFEF